MLFILATCSSNNGTTGTGGSTNTGTGAGATNLKPESDLTHNLFNWPAEPFTPTNKAKVEIFLHEGDYAIDFTLLDTSGQPYNLGGLLETRPVFLMTGSYT
jgi:hypothetical protein